MRILVYRPDSGVALWAEDLKAALPQAEVLVWREGDHETLSCDFAVIWAPPPALLDCLHNAKAIFLMGAGVDGILKYGNALPDVPIVRVGDAGMGVQMAEFVVHAVLRYFRRFDEYERQARNKVWAPLKVPEKADFSVGVLGTGKLGQRVLQALAPFGFPLRGWSRSARAIEGVTTFAGKEQLDDFLRGTRVLVCMLPLTLETTHLIDRGRLLTLPTGAYIINVARGALIAEPDLLTLIRANHIAGATLDVFRNEPLPAPHPFWDEPRIVITPHISGNTVRGESIVQMVHKMGQIERGEPVDDVVDRALGY